MAGVKFTVHTGKLGEILKNPKPRATTAEHLLAEQVMKDTAPFVPARDMSLSNRTMVRENLVVYPGPGAWFLYCGKVMVDPETGSTFAPKGGHKVVTDRNLVFSQAVHGQAQDHWCEASKAQNLEKWRRKAAEALRYGK